jgi:hypothetical protein
METVLSGLRYALGNFAKAGADPVQTLASIQDAIKNARTESEATALAFQVFGKRAAVDMGRAIIEGRMNIADLVKTLREGKDTINAADEASKTFGERMQELQQKTEKALVPIGGETARSVRGIAADHNRGDRRARERIEGIRGSRSLDAEGDYRDGWSCGRNWSAELRHRRGCKGDVINGRSSWAAAKAASGEATAREVSSGREPVESAGAASAVRQARL